MAESAREKAPIFGKSSISRRTANRRVAGVQ
jgi:hypothetical protein